MKKRQQQRSGTPKQIHKIKERKRSNTELIYNIIKSEGGREVERKYERPRQNNNERTLTNGVCTERKINGKAKFR